MKSYVVNVTVTASGTAEVIVQADSPEEAEKTLEKSGMDACELKDPDDFLNGADLELDSIDTAPEELTEQSKGGAR